MADQHMPGQACIALYAAVWQTPHGLDVLEFRGFGSIDTPPLRELTFYLDTLPLEVPMSTRNLLRTVSLLLFFAVCTSLAVAQNTKEYVPSSAKQIPPGSKVFVDPMPGGFETYLVAGLIKKKVPVIVVTDIRTADYEISGISKSDKANWAKMLFIGSQQSSEGASIKVVEVKTGEVVYAYSVHKWSSVHGKQSAAEACAKHLKRFMKKQTDASPQ